MGLPRFFFFILLSVLFNEAAFGLDHGGGANSNECVSSKEYNDAKDSIASMEESAKRVQKINDELVASLKLKINDLQSDLQTAKDSVETISKYRNTCDRSSIALVNQLTECERLRDISVRDLTAKTSEFETCQQTVKTLGSSSNDLNVCQENLIQLKKNTDEFTKCSKRAADVEELLEKKQETCNNEIKVLTAVVDHSKTTVKTIETQKDILEKEIVALRLEVVEAQRRLQEAASEQYLFSVNKFRDTVGKFCFVSRALGKHVWSYYIQNLIPSSTVDEAQQYISEIKFEFHALCKKIEPRYKQLQESISPYKILINGVYQDYLASYVNESYVKGVNYATAFLSDVREQVVALNNVLLFKIENEIIQPFIQGSPAVKPYIPISYVDRLCAVVYLLCMGYLTCSALLFVIRRGVCPLYKLVKWVLVLPFRLLICCCFGSRKGKVQKSSNEKKLSKKVKKDVTAAPSVPRDDSRIATKRQTRKDNNSPPATKDFKKNYSGKL